MASKLFASAICRSESSSATGRRFIGTTARLLQNQKPEAKELPASDDQEKIHNQIEEAKSDSEVGEDDGGGYEFVNKGTGEVGGPRGPEPTRYGDWEKNGRCSDF